MRLWANTTLATPGHSWHALAHHGCGGQPQEGKETLTRAAFVHSLCKYLHTWVTCTSYHHDIKDLAAAAKEEQPAYLRNCLLSTVPTTRFFFLNSSRSWPGTQPGNQDSRYWLTGHPARSGSLDAGEHFSQSGQAREPVLPARHQAPFPNLWIPLPALPRVLLLLYVHVVYTVGTYNSSPSPPRPPSPSLLVVFIPTTGCGRQMQPPIFSVCLLYLPTGRPTTHHRNGKWLSCATRRVWARRALGRSGDRNHGPATIVSLSIASCVRPVLCIHLGDLVCAPPPAPRRLRCGQGDRVFRWARARWKFANLWLGPHRLVTSGNVSSAFHSTAQLRTNNLGHPQRGELGGEEGGVRGGKGWEGELKKKRFTER